MLFNSVVNVTILIVSNLSDYLKYLGGKDSSVGKDNLSQAYIPVRLNIYFQYHAQYLLFINLVEMRREESH